MAELPQQITNLQQAYGEYATNTPLMQFIKNLGKYIGEPAVKANDEVQRLIKQQFGKFGGKQELPSKQMSEPEYRSWLLEQRNLGNQLQQERQAIPVPPTK